MCNTVFHGGGGVWPRCVTQCSMVGVEYGPDV